MHIEWRPGYVLLVGGPVPKGFDAITLGRLVSVRRAAATSRYVLRHELVHVRQWRRHGLIGFLVRYLVAYGLGRLRRKGHRGAYERIPFEIEADWVARRTFLPADEDTVPQPTRLP